MPERTGSNAQHDQHNDTNPDYQRGKCYGIVIEPVPALYTHNANPKIAEAVISDGPRGQHPWFSVTGAAITIC